MVHTSMGEVIGVCMMVRFAQLFVAGESYNWPAERSEVPARASEPDV